MKVLSILIAACFTAAAFAQPTGVQPSQIHYPQETHLKNIRQLTFGGDNAEAYWSFDGKK